MTTKVSIGSHFMDINGFGQTGFIFVEDYPDKRLANLCKQPVY